jgi:hypothetical protein
MRCSWSKRCLFIALVTMPFWFPRWGRAEDECREALLNASHSYNEYQRKAASTKDLSIWFCGWYEQATRSGSGSTASLGAGDVSLRGSENVSRADYLYKAYCGEEKLSLTESDSEFLLSRTVSREALEFWADCMKARLGGLDVAVANDDGQAIQLRIDWYPLCEVTGVQVRDLDYDESRLECRSGWRGRRITKGNPLFIWCKRKVSDRPITVTVHSDRGGSKPALIPAVPQESGTTNIAVLICSGTACPGEGHPIPDFTRA